MPKRIPRHGPNFYIKINKLSTDDVGWFMFFFSQTYALTANLLTGKFLSLACCLAVLIERSCVLKALLKALVFFNLKSLGLCFLPL